MTAPTSPPPDAIARSDQARAALRRLVDHVVNHHDDGCQWPHVCLGEPVTKVLYDTGADQLEELLATAILELAAIRTNNQKGH